MRSIAATCLAAIAAGSLAGSASSAPRRELDRETLLGLLRAGVPVNNARVVGELDLRPLRILPHPFTCTGCTFERRVIASDVTFTKAIDLSRSRFEEGVDLRGATFEGPVLFGSPRDDDDQRTTFAGPVDFTLATFQDLAGFQRTEFEQGADFTLARFRADSVFADAEFTGLADFRNATFGGDATFERGAFRQAEDQQVECDPDELLLVVACFESAVFRAEADFRQRRFEGAARFDRARFQGPADFSQATFSGEGSFVAARFGEGATFFGAHFAAEHESSFAVTFERSAATGRLDFADGTFSNKAQFRNLVAESLAFARADFAPGATLQMEGVSTEDLVLAVEDVDHVPAENRMAQTRILKLIESSAKAREDLRLANDAHYRLQVLASRDDGPLRRLADAIFYRAMAGYFVRPLRPLLILLALAIAVVLVRAALGRSAAGSEGNPADRRAPGGRRDRWVRRPLARAGHLLNELVETLALVGRSSPARERRGGSLVRLEILAYRALLVCALLGLANSNPTLRDMVDALF